MIGAGIVGVSTCWSLLEEAEKRGRRVRVTLVDHAGVAQAASGRAGGFLASEWCRSRPAHQLAKRGFQMHGQLAERFGAEVLEYRRLHTLTMASTRKGPRDGLSEWIDGSSVGSLSAIGSPANTAQVHPAKLAAALFGCCTAAACFSFRQQAAAGLQFSADGSRVAAVRLTGSGEEQEEELMSADAVVLCMGPWTGRSAAWFPSGAQWQGAQALASVGGSKAHSSVYRLDASAHAALPPVALFAEVDVYLRPSEVYCCDSEAASGPLPDDPRDVTLDKGRLAHLAAAARDISSLLAGPPAFESACYLPVSTHDSEPIVGRVASNVFMAAGHRFVFPTSFTVSFFFCSHRSFFVLFLFCTIVGMSLFKLEPSHRPLKSLTTFLG